MISMLIPVRRDSVFLRGLIHSIVATAYDIDNVEILVSFSKNEEHNLQLLKDFPFIKPCYDDKSKGRWGLHEYMNSIAEASTGDGLWHLCDDFRMVTKHFDLVINNHLERLKNEVYCFLPCPQPVHKIDGFVAPIITRKWYDTLGHWALNYAVDSWVGEILGYLPIERKIHIAELDLEDVTYSLKPMAVREDKDEIPDISQKHRIEHRWEDVETRSLIKADANKLLLTV